MSVTVPAADWILLSADVCTGMAEWRLAHPAADLTAIEAALDDRLAPLRARILQDSALASAQTHWADLPPAQQPRCPTCAQPLHPRGTAARHLQTHGGQELTLTRQYAHCSACGAGLFPPR